MNPTLECEITVADFIAFRRFLKRRLFKRVKGYYLIIGLGLPVGIAMGLLTGLTSLGESGPLPIMVGFIAGVVWLYVVAIVYARILTRQLQPSLGGYMLGTQTYELRSEGFHVRSTKHEALFRWEIVEAPAECQQHIFAMLEASAGVIIPKRCFRNEIEAKEFAAKIANSAKHSSY